MNCILFKEGTKETDNDPLLMDVHSRSCKFKKVSHRWNNRKEASEVHLTDTQKVTAKAFLCFQGTGAMCLWNKDMAEE
eukprot:scaffold6566_cov125-Amphora_coffeaeformis.AAC.10